ncbi:MAG: SGNH/GDSL hydrolase family protein [Planctomycetes bacterium]|nr:SGNH/GDSL hydrolase family protein [Planctomycetota bacterium]
MISDPSRMGQGRFGTPPELSRGGRAAYIAWDPTAGHVHLPNVRLSWPWPEYQRGKVKLRTNNLGLRRDVDTELRPPDGGLRVLVVGDSHVDGFVDNDQTFCQRLEEQFNQRPGSAPVEILNAGVITSGPHNYVGHVERFFQLGLDLVVVVFYSGNDFLNTVTTAALRGVIEVPPRSPEYLAQVERALGVQPVQQGPNQARLFTEFPELREQALAEVQKQMRWLRYLAVKGDFELLVVTLPSKFEIEWPTWSAPQLAAAAADYLEVLGLQRSDLEVNRQLTALLLTALREDDFAVIDLTDPMRAAGGKLFWDGDYHLSEAGHALVAQALFTPLAERLARR